MAGLFQKNFFSPSRFKRALKDLQESKRERRFPHDALLSKLRLRESLLREWVQPADKAGLEVGPFDRPLVRRDQHPGIKYLDYLSKEQLIEKARKSPHRNADAIPDIDYVSTNKPISSVVDQKFDYVIAVHVMEHLPDLFGWLNDLATVLNENGAIFAIIPNHSYIYDVDRPLSSLGEVFENFELKRDKPSPARAFDERFYHKNVQAPQLYEDYKAAVAMPRSFTIQNARHTYFKAKAGYVDCHCNVFSPDNFKEIILGGEQLEIHKFKVEHLAVNEIIANEFMTLLRLHP